MNGTPSDSQLSTQAQRSAPAAASWVLLVAPVVALLAAAYALAVALMVFPLGDLTPVLVLAVSLVARRWDGARARLFDLSAALAGLAVLEWVLAYVYLASVASVASPSALERIGFGFTVYFAQSVLMLVVFTAACLLSRQGVRRLRHASEAAI